MAFATSSFYCHFVSGFAYRRWLAITNLALALWMASMSAFQECVVASDDSPRTVDLSLAVRLDRPDSRVLSLAFSPDGRLVAGGTAAGSLVLWNADTGKETTTIDEYDSGVDWVTFSADGKALVTATAEDRLLSIRRLPDLRMLRRIELPAPYRRAGLSSPAIVLSRDGKTLATVLQTTRKEGRLPIVLPGELVVWDAATGKRKWSIEKSGVEVLAASPDSKQFAGYIQPDRIATSALKIWDADSGTLLGSYEPKGVSAVKEMDYLPNGKTLLFLSNFRMFVWPIAADGKTHSYEWHRSRRVFETFRLSGDGSLVGRAGADFVEVSNLETGKSESVLRSEGLMSPTLSADLKRLAASQRVRPAVFQVSPVAHK